MLLAASFAYSYGQFSFGVSPGLSFNTAYFGYKVNNKFVPYIGCQYLQVKYSYEENYYSYDWDLNQIVPEKYSSEFSANLIIPNIGLKYFIVQEQKLQAYVSVNLAKPLIHATRIRDGEEDTNFKKNINNISMRAGEFGFGVEYFLDEHFSLGGEFGLRYLNVKQKESYDREIYNPSIGQYQTVTLEEKYTYFVSPTFSKISFNFYF